MPHEEHVSSLEEKSHLCPWSGILPSSDGLLGWQQEHSWPGWDRRAVLVVRGCEGSVTVTARQDEGPLHSRCGLGHGGRAPEPVRPPAAPPHGLSHSLPLPGPPLCLCSSGSCALAALRQIEFLQPFCHKNSATSVTVQWHHHFTLIQHEMSHRPRA